MSFDMIPSVKYFQLWSTTIIWGNFWKPSKKVAFWALFYQKKDDFCWYSSGTAYFFCQIFGIEMIQYLHSKKMSKTSIRRLFWLFIAQKMIILANFVCFDMIPSVKYFQLWSKTIIWGNFWKSWQKVAFWALFYQKIDDFCWYSSGTAYFFCQIFGIEMIQYLHSKKCQKRRKDAFFGYLLPKNDYISQFCVFSHDSFC